MPLAGSWINMKSEMAEHDQKQSNDCNDAPMHDSQPQNPTPSLSQVLSEQVNPGNLFLRRGKWTPEEEAYALAAIRDFNSGHLDARPGTTLRSYLSEKLQCDPMRITKKFTGDASIGKKVFHPAVRDAPKTLKDIENSQAKLDHLYQQWKQRLELQEQEMARKSMAAVAVSVATTMCDKPTLPFSATSSPSHLLLGAGCMQVPPEVALTGRTNVQSAKANSSMTKTATWLVQAGTLLSRKVEKNQIREEIEEEMKEISRLINDAPVILSLSMGLPKLLDNKDSIVSADQLDPSIKKLHSWPAIGISSTKTETIPLTIRKRERSISGDDTATDSPNNPMKMLASLSSQAVPVPIDACGTGKRVKADSHTSRADAEDAKTFVNFLQSMSKNTF